MSIEKIFACSDDCASRELGPDLGPSTKPCNCHNAELTTLRERVKELEAELFNSEDRRKCWVLAHEGLERRLANWIKAHTELEQEYEKVCTSNHSLEKEVAELRHKVNALESKNNRKGPKFGDGLNAEDVNPSGFCVRICQGCGDTPLTTILDWKNHFVRKCIKCGRVL